MVAETSTPPDVVMTARVSVVASAAPTRGWRVRSDDRTIPAFLSIDVEPDGFQPADARFHGYAAADALLDRLRGALERVTGTRPCFGWYARTDSQMAALFGDAAAALRVGGDRALRRAEEGDVLGVHVHLVRRSEAHGAWVHDLRDRAFVRDAVAAALDTFRAATGAPARRFRMGACHLDDDVLDVLEAGGVEVETSLEPVRGWATHASTVTSGADASPLLGTSPDLSAAPRRPYRPSRRDLRREGDGADARDLVLVPVTTGPRRLPPGPLGRFARRVVGRPARPRSTVVLYPAEDGGWGDRRYWDHVEHALTRLDRPYVSLGVRTDPPGSERAQRVARRLEALVAHPLARRLRFVDPLAALDALVGPRAHDRAAAP